jgi:hypothetical protein
VFRPHGYAAHFNGHRWTQIPVPGSREITGVSTLGPKDFWAATGQPLILLAGTPHPPAAGGSVLHWTGKTWTAVKLPATLAQHAYLTSIIARSDRDVWVGGAVRESSAKAKLVLRTIVAHWDGRTWSVTGLADGGAPSYLTTSLAQDGNGGIWATGICADCKKFAPQLIWHWQRGRWTGRPQELLGAKARAVFATLAQVGHSSSVWAVGSTDSAKPHWLIGLYGKVPH